MKSLFFSHTGRINRAKFWFATACQMACLFSVVSVVAFLLEAHPEDAVGATQIVLVLVGTLTFIVAAYSAICIGVKRFHDRDKPGIWVLVQLVPAIGSLWYFIETGFLAGTSGQNSYGEDPLVSNRLNGSQ